MTLPAGKTTLKAWFRDAEGKDLCGAFYAYVRSGVTRSAARRQPSRGARARLTPRG